MKFLKCFSALLFTAFFSYAQLPKTEIWVFDLKQDATGYKLSKPTLVKEGDGYNNQPYFTQDGNSMYFVSNGKNGGRTDIYEYDFTKEKRNTKRLTYTRNESEYSPMRTPNDARISCVRVAKDTQVQNLCTYNLKGNKPKILYPNIKTFGYYCWKNQVELLAFHVPEPFLLRRHNRPYKKHDTLASQIGRCLQNQRGKILYVDKSDSADWKIKILNNKRLANREFDGLLDDEILTSTLKGAEDFALIRGKDIVMAKDGFIFMKPNVFNQKQEHWSPMADLNRYKLYDVYRIVVSRSGNRLALVARVTEAE